MTRDVPKKSRKATTGTIINKLERNIALANMRGDKASAERFLNMLSAAINSTHAPKVMS